MTLTTSAFILHLSVLLAVTFRVLNFAQQLHLILQTNILFETCRSDYETRKYRATVFMTILVILIKKVISFVQSFTRNEN